MAALFAALLAALCAAFAAAAFAAMASTGRLGRDTRHAKSTSAESIFIK